jgi:hypothetical protein
VEVACLSGKKDSPARLPMTPATIERAKAFLLTKWRLRAHDIGLDVPVDLTGSCKFSSLFAMLVFGGHLAGNSDHQFVVKNGVVLDLNAEAADVGNLPEPYRQEPGFIGNREHRQSMRSCLPRVLRWVEEFATLCSA